MVRLTQIYRCRSTTAFILARLLQHVEGGTACASDGSAGRFRLSFSVGQITRRAQLGETVDSPLVERSRQLFDSDPFLGFTKVEVRQGRYDVSKSQCNDAR